MADPIEYKGSIAGKRIFVTTAGAGTATVEELRQYLRRFPTRDMLRYIGHVSAHIDKERLRGVIMEGVPVPPYCLPYLALLSIESSNDRRGKQPDDVAFARAVQMFNNLCDPMTEEMTVKARGRSGAEFLMRMGNQQFELQGEFRHLIPRTLTILRDVWPTVPRAAGVSPDTSIKAISGGLSLDEVVLNGVAAYSGADNGLLHPLSHEEIASWGSGMRKAVNPESHAMLVKWLSASYARIRAFAKTEAPDSSYDQYRLNPLQLYPIVIPDVQPVPGRTTYIVPFRRFIWERVTRGLYHDLSKHHEGERGKNDFRVAFGYVFQEYVGVLLRKALGDDRVVPELKYGSKKATLDSPDWIVVEGDKAVLIEVKQSALFLQTKQWGHMEDAKADLKKNILKASSQLARFEQDIVDRKHGHLYGVRRFERLVVTFDNLHFANSVVREVIEEMREAGGTTPTHIHVGPVEDIEYILGHCWHGSLFELLERKRIDAEQDQMDFHDWMGHYLAAEGEDHRNAFLDEVFSNWMAGHGMSLEGASMAEGST